MNDLNRNISLYFVSTTRLTVEAVLLNDDYVILYVSNCIITWTA